MRLPLLMFITALVLSVAFSGCISSPVTTTPPAEPTALPEVSGTAGTIPPESPVSEGPSGKDLLVSIDPDILAYTPSMSSVPGIGLSPNLTGPAYPGSLRYHWQTDVGHFISWNAPDYVVRDLGADTTQGKEKIYWTYTATGAVTPGSTALITLTVEDAASGAMQAAAILEVEWDESGLNATVPG